MILGAGAFAEDIADMATEAGFDVAGFVENKNPARCEQILFDKPIYWIDQIAGMSKQCKAVCALGTTFRDTFIQQVQAIGFEFTSLIHPSARVSARSRIGIGSIISAAAVITAGAHIGCHVLINRGALIGHHVTIDDFASIGPGVNIGGSCAIGSKAYLGMGAIIRNNCSVGAHSVIGAGAVVVKNIPDRVEAIGIPAQIHKTNIEGL